MAIALCFGCSYWSSKCTINVNRVSLVELELCTIPERLSLTPVFSVWVRTNYYLWGIVWGSDHCACLTESDRKWRYQKRPFPEVTWFPPSIFSRTFSRTFFCTFSRTEQTINALLKLMVKMNTRNWKKGRLNSEKIWKIWKKTKLKSEKIRKLFSFFRFFGVLFTCFSRL
jgi:hypothetical protein